MKNDNDNWMFLLALLAMIVLAIIFYPNRQRQEDIAGPKVIVIDWRNTPISAIEPCPAEPEKEKNPKIIIRFEPLSKNGRENTIVVSSRPLFNLRPVGLGPTTISLKVRQLADQPTEL